MKENFEEISKNLNANYEFSSQKFWGDQGSTFNVDYHNLTIPYKDRTISLQYELGNHNMGQIICPLNSSSSMPKLTVESIGRFKWLFNKRQDILTIKCKDSYFKDFVHYQLYSLGIEQFAKDQLFEPEIFITPTKELKARFYLGFENKTEIIEPMIKLFKEFIKKDNR